MNVSSSWAKADKQWYLGVRCRRCHLPILFAVDRTGGIEKAQAPLGRKTGVDVHAGDMQTPGGLHRRGRVALSKGAG